MSHSGLHGQAHCFTHLLPTLQRSLDNDWLSLQVGLLRPLQTQFWSAYIMQMPVLPPLLP